MILDSDPAPVVCFMDESGTDATHLDDGVIGCFVINRGHLRSFNVAWRAMLRFHDVRGAFHLRDFGPDGANRHIVGSNRAMLFTAAVGIINEFKILASGASLHNRLREQAFSPVLKKRLLSSYGLAFMMCVAFQQKQAAAFGYQSQIDFVLDKGNRFRIHIERIHAAVVRNVATESYQVGSLTFESDDMCPALQAADCVAWATRRQRSAQPLVGVLAPLLGLFNDSYIENYLSEETLADLSERFSQIEATLGGP